MFAIEDTSMAASASSLHRCPSTQKEGENFERAGLGGFTYNISNLAVLLTV